MGRKLGNEKWKKIRWKKYTKRKERMKTHHRWKKDGKNERKMIIWKIYTKKESRKKQRSKVNSGKE